MPGMFGGSGTVVGAAEVVHSVTRKCVAIGLALTTDVLLTELKEKDGESTPATGAIS